MSLPQPPRIIKDSAGARSAWRLRSSGNNEGDRFTQSLRSATIRSAYFSVIKRTIVRAMRFSSPFSVVTATVDGDILSVMAATNEGFTVPQLSVIVRHRSVEGIRRSVNRLVTEGILDCERVGRTSLYRFNHDHLDAEPIREISRARERFIHRLQDRLSSWTHPPVFASLFGSSASGAMKPESDIDIFLVRPNNAEHNRWNRDVDALASDASRWTGNDVRMLVLSHEEITSGRSDEPVVDDIRRFGIPIMGQIAEIAIRGSAQ